VHAPLEQVERLVWLGWDLTELVVLPVRQPLQK
jgi:hypothetical protein